MAYTRREVADFFSAVHLQNGDEDRSLAWADVAERVRDRQRDRLLTLRPPSRRMTEMSQSNALGVSSAALLWLALQGAAVAGDGDLRGRRTSAHRTQRDAFTAFGVRLRQRGAALSFADRARPLDGQLRVRHLRLRVDLGA